MALINPTVNINQGLEGLAKNFCFYEKDRIIASERG